jgi:EpsI family protein
MSSGLLRCSITVLILAATFLGSKTIDSRSDESLVAPLESIPMHIDGWEGTADPPLRADILQELVPSSYISRTYRRGQDSVNLFIAYYANQHAGESMHSPKHCLPGAGWEILSYGETDLPVGGGQVRINHHTIQKDGARTSVFYWYQSRRRILADEYTAKLFLIRDAVMERKAGGAIVRVMFPANPTAQQGGSSFVAALFPELLRVIGWERRMPIVKGR